jgi:hypothetical protein
MPRTTRGNDNSIELCHRHSNGRRRVSLSLDLGHAGRQSHWRGPAADAPNWCDRRGFPGWIREGIREPWRRRALRPFGMRRRTIHGPPDGSGGTGRRVEEPLGLSRRHPKAARATVSGTGPPPARHRPHRSRRSNWPRRRGWC